MPAPQVIRLRSRVTAQDSPESFTSDLRVGWLGLNESGETQRSPNEFEQ